MKNNRGKILLMGAKHDFLERWGEVLGEWEVIFIEDSGRVRDTARVEDTEPAPPNQPNREEVLAVIGTAGALAKFDSPPSASHRRGAALILLTEDRDLVSHGNRIALPSGIHFLAHDASGAEIKRVLEAVSRARQEGAQSSTTQDSKDRVRQKSTETPRESWQFPEGKRFSSEIRFKEDWVKVVAHDIRSPLAIINSYARMLREPRYGISGQARLMLERIQDTGGWMIDLIDNILDLSLIEEGRLTLKFKPVRLEEILSSVGTKMKFLADSKQVRLEWDAFGDQKPYQLDHLKIEQVLHNLVINSIKNSNEGDRIHISGTGNDGEVMFQVEDTGRGMTKEQAEGIFEKFSPQTSEIPSGKGLGLAIAKSIVELHGGKIWVETTPGKGSVFSFTVVPQSG